MNTFVWTILVLLVLITIDIIVKIIWASTRNIPQRTPTNVGIVAIILMLWAAILLSH